MKIVSLGDYVSIKGGGTPSRERTDYYNGPIPWATVKDFGDSLTLARTQESITEKGLKESASNLIPAGNVILATRMAVGKVAINRVELAINQDLKALSCKPGLNPKYLLFFLLANSHYLNSRSSGATVKGITLDLVEELNLPLPSLEEQKRIADILGKANRLRRTRRYAQQLSDTFLQSVFLDVFGSVKHRLLPFEELALNKRGAFVNGPFGSDLLTTELTTQGVPVVYIRDIRNGVYERVSDVFVTPQKAKELEFCQVTSGDVLVAKVGDPPGTAAIYPSGEPVGIVTQDVVRIKTNPSVVTAEYLTCFLNSSKGYSTLHPIIIEGTRARFGLTPYKQLYIPIPPLTEQEKFTKMYKRFERLRAQQREAARQAEHLFQTLLRRAFRGEL